MSGSGFSDHVSLVFDKAVDLHHLFHPFTETAQREEPPGLANRLGAIALLVLSVATLGTVTALYFYWAHKKVVRLEKGAAREAQISALYKEKGPQAFSSLSLHEQIVIKSAVDLKAGASQKALLRIQSLQSKEALTSQEKMGLFRTALANEDISAVLELVNVFSIDTFPWDAIRWNEPKNERLYDAIGYRIPKEKFDAIQYDTLDKEQIAQLFPFDNSKTTDQLGCLSEENFKKVVSKFSDKQFARIPVSHLSYLDLAALKEEQIRLLFPIENGFEREQTTEKLKALSEDHFKIILGKFPDDGYFSVIPDNHLNHLDFPKLPDHQLLTLFSLKDLAFWHTKDKLSKLDKDHLAQVACRFQQETYFSLIAKHCNLNDLDYDRLTPHQIACLFADEVGKRLETLNEEPFKKVISKLESADIYAHIPDKYRPILNYKNLKPEQIKALFPVDAFNPNSTQSKETQKRLTELNEENFKIVADKSQTNDAFFWAIPDQHLNQLDYDTLSSSQIASIFISSKKLELLSETNFRKAVAKFEKDRFFSLIPDNQLHFLDFSTLTPAQTREIFPLRVPNEKKETLRKLTLLNEANYKTLLYKPGNEEYFSLITELNSLDYPSMTIPQLEVLFGFKEALQWGSSALKETSHKLAQLKENNFKAIVKTLAETQAPYFSCFPDSQLHLLDYSRLTTSHIEFLFFSKDLSRGYSPPEIVQVFQHRIELIPLNHFQSVVSHFKDRLFSYIPDSRLNDLDYSSLQPAQLEKLFPGSIIDETTEKRLSQLSNENFKTVFKNLNSGQLRWIPFSHFHLIEWNTLSEQQISSLFPSYPREKFTKLSSAQLLLIFDKLNDLLIYSITEEQLRDPQLRAKYNAYFYQKHGINLEKPNDKYCAILGISTGLSKEEIKKAYIKLARLKHPDSLRQKDGETPLAFAERKLINEEEMKLINVAYHALVD